MRIVTIVVAALAVSGPAVADQREDLQAKGEQLAKDGRYGDAIDAFKAADRIQPRASHACLISLAYTRRELWPQAELFLSICHQRANQGDPLPDWVALADQQIRERLAAANVAEVKIEVKPATAAAKVTVSSFAPDEVFEPRTIHLPLGTHVVFARADGFPDGQATIVLETKTPQTVVIELGPRAQPPVAPAPSPPPSRGKRGGPLLVGGAIALGLGIATHAWMAFERSELVRAQDATQFPHLAAQTAHYDKHSGRFDTARYLTIGLYAASAALVTTGLVVRANSAEQPAVAAVPLPEGGALVSVGWQR